MEYYRLGFPGGRAIQINATRALTSYLVTL